MSHGLRLDPTDAVPLWKQLEDGLRRLVASGRLPRGADVPSVREMAQTLQVNPSTIVRAYKSLVEAGIFEARPGLGTLVSEKGAVDRGEARAALEAGADRLAELAASLEVSTEDAVTSLRGAFRRLKGRK
jgi:GntR family transcriptional regulator